MISCHNLNTQNSSAKHEVLKLQLQNTEMNVLENGHILHTVRSQYMCSHFCES